MREFAGELLGTAILIIFGNGVVANVLLSKTKGFASGWIVIAFGWAMAVYIGVFAVAELSGAHLNPAVTISFAAAGKLPWLSVPKYIVAQLLGAFLGAVIVFFFYREHFKITSDPGLKSACFFTAPNIRNIPTAIFCEVTGTFLLLLPILLMIDPKFAMPLGPDQRQDVKLGLGALGSLPVGLLVLGIGLSLGGTTGYAINPARDFAPRLAHAVLPIPGKGSNDWSYAWVPIVGPILGGLLAAGVAMVFANL
jgi:glycerol uptake facilitator protein